MTTIWLTLVLLTGLATLAFAGPALLRSSAPALVRAPRFAVFSIVMSIGLWFVALLAVGPLLAWGLTGPAWLPSQAADVCQRCLDSANPFTSATYDSAIPVITLLAAPILGVTVLVISSIREIRRRGAATKDLAASIQARARSTTLHGFPVLIVEDPAPFVFSLPARRGGIVVSNGAIAALNDDELKAVLEHERAHLAQRHHAISSFLVVITRQLRWVPFVAAGSGAVPYYLEIAADNAARKQWGTPALASALLTLGEPTGPGQVSNSTVGILNAAGPNRVCHLVNPVSAKSGLWPVAVLSLFLVVFSIFNLVVHGPYLGAAMTGCAL